MLKKIIYFASIIVLASLQLTFAQKLPQNLTCQDLIDVAAGKMSRSTDGGLTYVPVKRPYATDPFAQNLLAHDTQLCQQLSRGGITLDEFNTSHNEKMYKLNLDRNKVMSDRQKALADQKVLENQGQALQNQQRALENQQSSINIQQQAVDAQRRATWEASRQAEITRKQQANQHQQLMEQQQQSQRRSITCFGGGSFVQCN